LKSMHLVFLAIKSICWPRKECCMALKLVWRFVNTVSKEGPDVYRMVSFA
jgi:energy-coupling factor transporter transmembrane protein EcfT